MRAREGYDERLHAPAWSHLLPLPFALPLLLTGVLEGGATRVLSSGGERLAVGFGVAVLAGGELLVLLVGRVRLSIVAGRLTAGTRSLDAGEIAGVTTLRREGMRSALGPQGDPSAYRVTRPWVPTGIYVTTRAGEGWLLSTRHPELLADALGLARASR